ncbi:MAG: response regulator [Pseudanabaena sp. Salubria-1]|nr:response regulator [Pseudanabaena sp. Salubria-1]
MSASTTRSLPGSDPTPFSLPTANSKNAIAPLILLVEDNEANIQTFTSYLSAYEYRLVLAKNGEEGVAMAKAHQPDIILMDIQMPVMDGLRATQLIRAEPKLATVPIIALTARAMQGDQELCIKAGANQYLSKPHPRKKTICGFFFFFLKKTPPPPPPTRKVLKVLLCNTFKTFLVVRLIAKRCKSTFKRSYNKVVITK